MGAEKDHPDLLIHPSDVFTITDLETLQVVTHPLRLKLLNLLRGEPRTVKELARALHHSQTKLYYHISVLENHQLVRVTRTRLVSGILEKQYQATAYKLTVDPDLFSPMGSTLTRDEGREVSLSAVLDFTPSDLLRSMRAGLVLPAEDAPAERKLQAGRHLLTERSKAAATNGTQITARKSSLPGERTMNEDHNSMSTSSCEEGENDMLKVPQIETNALWKQRYRTGSLLSATLARRNPARGMVISAHAGTAQLYAWDISSDTLRQLTHSLEGVFEGMLAPDGRAVYYLCDEGGSERGHYVRLSWDGGEAQDITPDMPPYAALYRCAVSEQGDVFAFTPTKATGFPLYCLDLNADGSLGTPRELYRSPKFIDDVALSPDGRWVVVATTEFAKARQYSLLAFEVTSGKRVGELSDLPDGSVRAVRFSPLSDDARLLCMADHSGYQRPFLWNPSSGERLELAIGALAGEVEALDWSLDGRSLLLRQVSDAVDRLHLYDLETGTLTPLLHPAGTYLTAQFGPAGQIATFWTDATHAPQLVTLDVRTGARTATLVSMGESLPAHPFRSIQFPSSDGTAIQGWLGLPEGQGPFPTILSLHGGPLIAARDTYDPEAQSWLDHGYAFLTINYRGSTTFGREFKEQIWGDLGHWEVEDMVAAHNWLLREGIAQPNAVLVTGASYGGYLTLMALGKYPDLWAGGMALVTMADLTAEYEEGTDWTKGYNTAMMGGTPAELPEQYHASSPITYVERVAAPLLVIQGRNDLRSPPRPMERYAEKMQALGKPFELDWFDAGHAGFTIEQSIAFQERMLAFAYRLLTRA